MGKLVSNVQNGGGKAKKKAAPKKKAGKSEE